MDTLSILLIAGICVLNVFISWWNAYVCGRNWEDAKQAGGFIRVLMWCAAAQSAIGFSSVYIIGLLLAATGYYMAFPSEAMTPADIADLWNYAMSFWYLAVIFPALGSGLVITIHSWMEAYRRRDFGSMAVAGYNTFAQVSNMYRAGSGIGQAGSVLGEAFGKLLGGKGDAKGKVLILAFLLAVVAILAGVLTTATLIQKYARTAPRMSDRAVAA